MLHKETVDNELLAMILDLQSKPQLAHFSLGGGTALSLHIGHRKSIDIDLFTLRPILQDRLQNFLNETYEGRVRYTSEGSGSDFVHSFINKVKVDFLCYRQVYIEEPQKIEGIKILGLKDIAALKLQAIALHRNEAKDFADVFFLLKEYTVSQLLQYYQMKYKVVDTSHVRKALLSYNRVEQKAWDDIKFTGSITPEEIKTGIKKAVKEYNLRRNHD